MDLTCLLSCWLYYSDIHFILISWYAWIKCNQCAIPYYYRDKKLQTYKYRDTDFLVSWQHLLVPIALYAYRVHTYVWSSRCPLLTYVHTCTLVQPSHTYVCKYVQTAYL